MKCGRNSFNLYPMIQSEKNGDLPAYSRSTSLESTGRYGGSGTDLSRLHHRLSSSTERLDEEKQANDKYSSDFMSSKEMSSPHKSYQVTAHHENQRQLPSTTYFLLHTTYYLLHTTCTYHLLHTT